jgi:hypothetical protein
MNTLKTIYDKLGDKTELAKHEVNLAGIDDIYKSIFEANKLANNSQVKQSIAEIGKSTSSYTNAKTEINVLISKISAIDASLLDSNQGKWLKTSLQICDDNIKKLQQAQGALNQADKIINSLQSKSKL